MKHINYEYTIYYFNNNNEDVAHEVPSTRKEVLESHIDWALENGGNSILIMHRNKPTIKVHNINKVYIEQTGAVSTDASITTYDEDGDIISTAKLLCINGMKIYDMYGESEVEEFECEHLPSVLVG